MKTTRDNGAGVEMNALPEALPSRPAENVLQPILDSLISERWWGLYANNTRVGKYHLVGKRVTTAEGDGVNLIAEAWLEVPPPVVRMRWESEFAKNGKPLRLQEQVTEEDEFAAQTRTTTFDLKAGQVHTAVTRNAGPAREIAYAIPTDHAFLFRGVESAEMFMVAASVQPLVGKSYEYGVASEAGAVPLVVVVEDRETVRVRGQESDCLRLSLQQGKLTRRIWMTDDRRIVKWVEVGADGKEGVTALAGTTEESESDLGETTGIPGPQEAVLAFIKAMGAQNREIIDILCDYDALYSSFLRSGRLKDVSRSAFNVWFRDRLGADPNLAMSNRSAELLRPLLKTVVRGDKSSVAFTDPKSGQDFFRFSFRLTDRGWLVTDYAP